MVNFKTSLIYYYHHILKPHTLSKGNVKEIGMYFQTELVENNLQQLHQLTNTPLGEASGEIKLYPIDIIYALATLDDTTILYQCQKSNLNLPEFVFLVNALQEVIKILQIGEKT